MAWRFHFPIRNYDFNTTIMYTISMQFIPFITSGDEKAIVK